MAVTTAKVAAVHWLNWLGYPIVIRDDTEIIAGTLTAIQYQRVGGIYLISLGSTVLRYAGHQSITFGTPADASQALYGVALTPQTP